MEGKLMANTFIPLGDYLSFQKVLFDKIVKNNQNLIKAINILANPPEVEVGTTPADIVYQINDIKLLHRLG
jgi:hypothetical protein